MSFETKMMEKFAIVTSPESALGIVDAIFRIQEPEAGSIRIDNVPIAHLDLTELRKSVSIIPSVRVYCLVWECECHVLSFWIFFCVSCDIF